MRCGKNKVTFNHWPVGQRNPPFENCRMYFTFRYAVCTALYSPSRHWNVPLPAKAAYFCLGNWHD
jgi:hypothetical protein